MHGFVFWINGFFLWGKVSRSQTVPELFGQIFAHTLNYLNEVASYHLPRNSVQPTGTNNVEFTVGKQIFTCPWTRAVPMLWPYA